MGRKPTSVLVIITLTILVALGGVVTPSYVRADTSSTATTCPPSCQEVVPVLPYVNGSAAVQTQAQPPVYGGDSGMFISNEGSDTVSVVSGGLTAANVPVGPAPLAGAYDPYGGLFYVPDSGANEVSVLAGAALDKNVMIQASPMTPAFDPLNGYVYVPDNGGCDIDGGSTCGSTVSVFSGLSVIANITVGTGPEQPVVDTNVNSPYYGFVYVPNAVSQDISVISGKNNSVVATIGSGPTFPVLVPRPPGGGVYDPSNDYVYMGSYIIHGVDAVGELPTLSMANLVIHANEAPPQVQVSCTSTCVYDAYNGLIYEPSDPYQPVFGGYFIINGTGAIASSCDDCGSPDAVLNPNNGWVYMGSEVISGYTPFALAAPIAGATEGPLSFNPSDGYVYGVYGESAVRLGNFCPQVGGEFNYSALDLQICNGGGSNIVQMTNNVTATTSGGVNGSGAHIFTIVTAGNIPMASGNWTAQGSKIVGQAGGATISFSLTGQSGSKGMATIKILKSEVVFLLGLTALGGSTGLPTSKSIASWLPQLYVDGQQVTDTTITQDSTYIYVTFPIHFSSHQIALKWIPSADAIGTSNSTSAANTTSSSTSLLSSGTGVTTASSTTQANSSSSSSAGLKLALDGGYLILFGVSMVAVLLVSTLLRPKRAGVRHTSKAASSSGERLPFR